MMEAIPEMAVLRRFRKLNILRLLEMQSKLCEQERTFRHISGMDAKSDCATTRSYLTNWKSLCQSQGIGGTEQRDAWTELRDGLEAYSKSFTKG